MLPWPIHRKYIWPTASNTPVQYKNTRNTSGANGETFFSTSDKSAGTSSIKCYHWPKNGASLEYMHIIKGQNKSIWENSFANEIGRLPQGVGTRMTSGTNTIFFTSKGKGTAGRTVTYGRIVAKTQPLKDETYRTILTVGGNLFNFPGDVTTPTEMVPWLASTVTEDHCYMPVVWLI